MSFYFRKNMGEILQQTVSLLKLGQNQMVVS